MAKQKSLPELKNRETKLLAELQKVKEGDKRRRALASKLCSVEAMIRQTGKEREGLL